MSAEAMAQRARQARLQAHIDAVADRPCIWGRDDCTRWAADWVEAERGMDLGLPAYRSEDEARLRIAAAGGLLGLWRERLGASGIFTTVLPGYGDVGLVETRLGPVGVIVAHDGVCALRSVSGVSFLRPRRFLEAWAVAPC